MNALTSPILLRGDDVTAYRDPAAVLLNGVCYLYFTYVGQIRIPLKIGRESLNESEPA